MPADAAPDSYNLVVKSKDSDGLWGNNSISFDVEEFVADVRKVAQNKPTGSVESEVDPVEDIIEGIAIALEQMLAPAVLPEDRS